MENDNKNEEQLKDRLFKCRIATGLSAAEIARKLSTTSAQVHAWEKLGRTPVTGRLHKLAELYGVTPAYLLFGEGYEVVEHPNNEGDAQLTSEDFLFRNCFSFQDRLQAVLNDRGVTPDRLALFTAMPENELLGYLRGSGCDILARIMVISDVLGIDRCALAFGVKR